MTGEVYKNLTPAEQEVLDALREAKVFHVKRGQATLIFDEQGILKQVEIKVMAYRRRKKV